MVASFSRPRAMVASFSRPTAMAASFSRPTAMAASFSPPGIWPRTGALPSPLLILALLIPFVASRPPSLPDSVNGVEDGHNFYCFHGFIRCMSGIKQCIMPEQQCDGLADCNDGSDEGVNCQHFNCTPLARIKCPSGMMCTISSYADIDMMCDGLKDCADGSDEDPSYCATYDCNSDERLTLSPADPSPITRMSCPGGRGGCVRQDKLCDGVVDCVGDGGSDEEDEYCKKRGCEVSRRDDLLQCRSGRCIERMRMCDGKRDCPEGEDEGEFCERMDCPGSKVKCRGGNNRTCIGEDQVCDGVEDCPGGTDEAECDKQPCPPWYSKCPSGKGCAPFRYKLCDGWKDCADGSDEDPTFCRTVICSPDWEIKCKDEVTCISKYSLCDRRKDCPDKSDEDPVYCRERHNCTEHLVKCPGSQYVWCTSRESLCDGVVGDCYGDAEEKSEFCNSTETALLLAKDGRINCISNVTYYFKGELCDGKEDCRDGSDERPEFCRRHHCREGKVKCYGKRCVPGRRCDGERDCPDGSDEEGCSPT